MSKQMVLIRETPQKQNEFMKHLNENGVTIKSFDYLTFIFLDASKHLLVSDFLNIYTTEGKLNFRSDQNIDNEFTKMLDNLKNNDLRRLNYYDVQFENLIFCVNQDQIKLLCLFKNQYSNKSLSQEKEKFITALKQKNHYTQTTLYYLVREAIGKSLTLLSTKKFEENNDYIKFVLQQRLNFKMQFLNQKQPFEKIIDNIFNHISELSGSVRAGYIQRYLVEQPLEALVSQLKFLQYLSKQHKIINDMELSLFNQGAIQFEIEQQADFLQHLMFRAEDILNQSIQNKGFLQTIDTLRDKILQEQTAPQNQFKKQEEIRDQIQNSQILCSIFLQNFYQKFWIFEEFKLTITHQKVQQAIKQVIKPEQNLIIKYQNNEDVLQPIIKQILQYSTQFDLNNIFGIFIENLIDESITKLQVQTSPYFQLNQKVAFKNLRQNLQNQQIQFQQLLKNNEAQQFSILESIFQEMKETITSICQKEQQNLSDEEKENFVIDFLKDLSDNNKHIYQSQMETMHKDFQEQLLLQCEFTEDKNMLQKYMKIEDFIKFCNPLCNSQFILHNTKYKQCIQRMKMCWMQYFKLSYQISDAISFTNEDHLNIRIKLEEMKQNILCQSFVDYVIQNEDESFNFQFYSFKIKKECEKLILESLHKEIESHKQKEIQTNIQNTIQNYRTQFASEFIPFDCIEKQITSALKEDKSVQEYISKYREISEFLFKNQENDFQTYNFGQEQIQQWSQSNEISKIFSTLKNSQPQNWNQEQLQKDLDQSRFLFFLAERKEFKLKSAITLIHNLFNSECCETLNNPPDLVEFDLQKDNQYHLDQAISVDQNERLFTIDIRFLEQVYQFYEVQIQRYLQNQLNELSI